LLLQMWEPHPGLLHDHLGTPLTWRCQ
jgi:hypothetical protein